ncbi:SMP-30/gluconolactonase/LRE family protein [Oceanicella sp. SM1341]|uniref:SMP-30/gluconolactonase/LRE family protein n=1 Tax=Oceanicella sp. SM1341 TaxID=1548889 RepID=UPI0013004BAB|nr:SMP-30/gluconolactonase/LRE family protein [Oceanicella sp. SM1341]
MESMVFLPCNYDFSATDIFVALGYWVCDHWPVNRFLHAPPRGGAPLPPSPGLSFTPASDTTAELGESPFWCPLEGCLWWVDIAGRRLLRTDPASGATAAWPTPEEPGFVVLTGPGAPAVGMESGIFAFSPGTARFTRILPLEAPGTRFNDATVDAAGRLWAATMDITVTRPLGALYRFGPEGPERLLDGLSTPNGLAVDAGLTRLWLSDSHPSQRHVWTLPLTGAAPGPRRPFATLAGPDGRPDGAAIDSAGDYWIAGVDGGALHVFAPDGTHRARHATPSATPTKPAFAGGRLFLTAKHGPLAAAALAAPVPPLPYWKPAA